MSEDLYFEPSKRKRRRSCGDFQLRNIINDKFGYQGSLDMRHSEYIEGLVDAKIEGAQELLSAIREHGSIDFTIES